jgi:hypothetical protein
MSREILDGPCFLCQTQTQYYEFDGNKRRHYDCPANECGEYIITDMARRRLDWPHMTSTRSVASEWANARTTAEKVLEIWINPSTKELEGHLVDRPR